MDFIDQLRSLAVRIINTKDFLSLMPRSLFTILIWLLCSATSQAALVDLKINGSDGPLRVAEGTPLIPSIRIEPDGSLKANKADWWFAVNTGKNWAYYVYPSGWQLTPAPATQINPVSVPSLELPGQALPPGEYTFYFALDDEPDGLPQPTWLDSVSVTVTPADRLPPKFEGIVSVAASGADGIALKWLAASDNRSVAKDIGYEIHVSDQKDFTPSSATRKTLVTGQLEGSVSGLPTGKPLYVLIVAIDGDGNASLERDFRTFQVNGKESKTKTGVIFKLAADMGFGDTTISGNTLTVQKIVGTTIPAVGTVISGNDTSGKTWFGQVASSVEQGGNLVITLTSIALDEVLGSVKVSNQIKAVDLSGMGKANTFADGRTQREMHWNGLSITQIEHLPQRDGYYHTNINRFDAVSANNELSLSIRPSFRPVVKTEIEKDSDGNLIKAEVIADAELKLEARLHYKFAGAASYSKEIPVLTYTIDSLYMAGPVPVQQDITVSLTALVEASAETAIDAEAIATLTRFITVGARFNKVTGKWEPVIDSEFEKSLTVNLNAEGTVKGQVRFIPNIEVKFYKVVAAGLSVEPYLRAEAAIQAVATAGTGQAPVAYTQPKTFDFALGVECKAYLRLNMLVATLPLLEGTVCGPYENMLFSLPTIKSEIAATSTPMGKKVALTTTVTDGASDPFEIKSLKYEIYPSGKRVKVEKGTVTKLADGSRKIDATLTACDPGDYVVYVSGYGRLGEFARQYSVPAVKVENAGSCELTAKISASTDMGAVPLVVSFDASESSDPDGNIVSYEWSANGQTSTGQKASFTFDKAGAHSVTLTVKNGAGKTSSAMQLITAATCNYGNSQSIEYSENCSAMIMGTPKGDVQLVRNTDYYPNGAPKRQWTWMFMKSWDQEGVPGLSCDAKFYTLAMWDEQGRPLSYDKVSNLLIGSLSTFESITTPISAFSAIQKFGAGCDDFYPIAGYRLRFNYDGSTIPVSARTQHFSGTPNATASAWTNVIKHDISCNSSGTGSHVLLENGKTTSTSITCSTPNILPIARPASADKSKWKNWQ